MKHIVLFLIAFIAVVTFIRAFDRTDAEAAHYNALHDVTKQAAVESVYNGSR